MMPKGRYPHKLVVITGPPVSGKSTVANDIVKWLPLKKIISTTTRSPRSSEKRGVDYHFISRSRFDELVEQGLMFEYNEYSGELYGRQRKDMRRAALEDLVPLLVVDPNEALDIQKRHPDALVLFIKPVSLSVIKQRLTARGGEIDEINRRLQLAKEAMSSAPVFAYTITNPDGHLDDTLRLVKKTVRGYLGL